MVLNQDDFQVLRKGGGPERVAVVDKGGVATDEQMLFAWAGQCCTNWRKTPGACAWVTTAGRANMAYFLALLRLRSARVLIKPSMPLALISSANWLRYVSINQMPITLRL